MEESSGGRRRAAAAAAAAAITSLDADLLSTIFSFLDDHFDIVRCSAVCKSWHNIIHTSSLLKDLYYKRYLNYTAASNISIPLETSLKKYLEDLAMEQHRLSLLDGFVEVHQWNVHNVGVRQCRMKNGLILTGVGDKLLRIWSSKSYKCLGQHTIPDMAPLVDFDFDESKIVGLFGTRLCIWRHNGKRSIFPSSEGTFTRGLCMRYVDPEAVIGCEDGTARAFDMYSRTCSRIIRTHAGPITCLSLTDDQLILSGSTFGNITVAGFTSDQRVASLKSSTVPAGISSLCFNSQSYLVFAGSTSGYSHCWDLRTMRPLWTTKVSPNVVYSMQHMQNDTSSLIVGGIDGVLRVLNQDNGELLSSYVMIDQGNAAVAASSHDKLDVVKKKARRLSKDVPIDSIPKHLRPAITCVAVGMNKVVTVHNTKYIRMWKFNK